MEMMKRGEGMELGGCEVLMKSEVDGEHLELFPSLGRSLLFWKCQIGCMATANWSALGCGL